MKCARCRTRLPPEGYYVTLYRFGTKLCHPCYMHWNNIARPHPIWLCHRWKFLFSLALLFLALVSYEAQAEDMQPVVSKTCYRAEGALTYPFHCEQYHFTDSKGGEHLYWVGWNAGHVYRVEEETPFGTIVLYTTRFVHETDA